MRIAASIVFLVAVALTTAARAQTLGEPADAARRLVVQRPG